MKGNYIIMDIKIYFAKTNPKAIIPSKREEDAGYDIYPCIDKDIVIQPHTTVMIPTGIASACPNDYFFKLVERGSSGSKGIAQRCGVIDSGYRDTWFVPVTNTNDYPIVIPAEEDCKYIKFSTDNYKRTNTYFIVYPFKKAIAQAILLPVPKTKIIEIPYNDLMKIESERGIGKLGSSQK